MNKLKIFSYEIPHIEEKYLHMELVLHALAETELISKDFVNSRIEFKDPLHDALDDIFD